MFHERIHPDATDVSSITVAGPDGLMPEIATRSFNVSSTAAALQQFYSTKCEDAALSEPGGDLLHLEPAVICEGQGPTGTAMVLLFSECADTLFM